MDLSQKQLILSNWFKDQCANSYNEVIKLFGESPSEMMAHLEASLYKALDSRTFNNHIILVARLVVYQGVYPFKDRRAKTIYKEILSKLSRLEQYQESKLYIVECLATLLLSSQMLDELQFLFNKCRDLLQGRIKTLDDLMVFQVLSAMTDIVNTVQANQLKDPPIPNQIKVNLLNQTKIICKENKIICWNSMNQQWLKFLSKIIKLCNYFDVHDQNKKNTEKIIIDYLKESLKTFRIGNQPLGISAICECLYSNIYSMDLSQITKIVRQIKVFPEKLLLSSKGLINLWMRIILRIRKQSITLLPPQLVNEINKIVQQFFQVILHQPTKFQEVNFKQYLSLICALFFDYYDNKSTHLGLKKIANEQKHFASSSSIFLLQSFATIIYKKDIQQKTMSSQKIILRSQAIIKKKYLDNQTYFSPQQYLDMIEQVLGLKIFLKYLPTSPMEYILIDQELLKNMLLKITDVLNWQHTQNNQYFWELVLRYFEDLFDSIFQRLSKTHKYQKLPQCNITSILKQIQNLENPTNLFIFLKCYSKYFKLDINIQQIVNLLQYLEKLNNINNQQILANIIISIIKQENNKPVKDMDKIRELVKKIIQKLNELGFTNHIHHQLLHQILIIFQSDQQILSIIKKYKQKIMITICVLSRQIYRHRQNTLNNSKFILKHIYIQQSLKFIAFDYRIYIDRQLVNYDVCPTDNHSFTNLLCDILVYSLEQQIKYDINNKCKLLIVFIKCLGLIYNQRNIKLNTYYSHQILALLIQSIKHNEQIFKQIINYKYKHIAQSTYNFSKVYYQYSILFQMISENILILLQNSQSIQSSNIHLKNKSLDWFKQLTFITNCIILIEPHYEPIEQAYSLKIERHRKTYFVNMILSQLWMIRRGYQSSNRSDVQNQSLKKRYMKLLCSKSLHPTSNQDNRLARKKSKVKQMISLLYGSYQNTPI